MTEENIQILLSRPSYKEYHESFMQNNNGTSQIEIISVIVPNSYINFIASILFITCFKSFQSLGRFFIEFCVVIIPIILSCTLLSDYIFIINTTLLTITTTVAIKYLIDIFLMKDAVKIMSLKIPNQRRDFVASSRAIINVMTAVCILAVDFKIFPRRFAKTETFGFGLMDVGVGLYVFGNGIIAPEIYKPKNVPFLQLIKLQVINTIPLFLLGIGRTIVTKEIDYQEHVSEYGVQWNFFLTLGIAKLVGTILISVINFKSLFAVATTIAFIYELLLANGFLDYVMSTTPRDTFIHANREGIISLIGYVSLYLYSVRLGLDLNVKSASLKDNLKLVIRLFSYAVLLHFLTFIYHKYFGVSRRLANFGYCTFILSIGTTMTCLLLAFELLLHIYYQVKTKSSEGKLTYIPLIYKSVDYNGLLFFLTSNITTGLVNLLVQTLFVNELNSVFIIILYMLVNSFIAVIMYTKNIKLKVW